MMKRGDIVIFCKSFDWNDNFGHSYTIPKDTKVIFLSQGIDKNSGTIVACIDHGGIILEGVPVDSLREVFTAPKDKIWAAVKSCSTGSFCRA